MWLAGRGFTSYCTVDDDGAQDPDADAITIGGCGYVPGQATIVRAGTYREDVRPTASNFAVVGYPGEAPVISGADVVDVVWTQQTDGTWRTPWVWAASSTTAFGTPRTGGASTGGGRW